MHKQEQQEIYRTVRLSNSNLEFLDSISKKGDSYDELLKKVISAARTNLLGRTEIE